MGCLCGWGRCLVVSWFGSCVLVCLDCDGLCDFDIWWEVVLNVVEESDEEDAELVWLECLVDSGGDEGIAVIEELLFFVVFCPFGAVVFGDEEFWGFGADDVGAAVDEIEEDFVVNG